MTKDHNPPPGTGGSMTGADSSPMYTWRAAGCQPIPYPLEGIETVCATCGIAINIGVHLKKIETASTSDHASCFRFGSSHVCRGCAWLYSSGKGKPGNYLATDHHFEHAVISPNSIVVGKRHWMEILSGMTKLPAGERISGVMTTDVKPRLWPRARIATVGRFGLYLHAPEYDVSEWREFGLRECLDLIRQMVEPLTAGYSKASLYHGLLRDHTRTRRAPERAIQWEQTLAQHRAQTHFLPALIAAGVTR